MSKRIRKPVFGPRSALPPSAACVVANGVRETLTSILSSPVEMRVFEPSIPTAPAWPAIVKDAVLYRVRGSIADAAIVLRSPTHSRWLRRSSAKDYPSIANASSPRSNATF